MSVKMLKALVHFIVHECRDDPRKLGSVRLNKALWFTDVWTYKSAGKPVTGARYVKREMGPVPKAILPVLRQLEAEGKIEIHEPTNYYEPRMFVSNLKPDVRGLSDSGLETAKDALGYVCDNSANDISNITHDEVWHAAMEGEEIPLFATLATGKGAITDDTKEWANNIIQEIQAQ